MRQSYILLKTAGILLCFVMLVVLASCVKNDIEIPAYKTKPAAEITLDDVYKAIHAQDMETAEVFAMRFASRNDISKDQQLEAWRLAALAATKNIHPNAALTSLENWRKLAPLADDTSEWRTIWYTAITQLPTSEAEKQAYTIIRNKNRPDSLQAEARLFLLENQLTNGVIRNSLLRNLESLYNENENPAEKQALEQRMFIKLHSLTPDTLSSLSTFVNENNDNRYPYALIKLEEARRLFLDMHTREQALEIVTMLKEGSNLNSSNLFTAWNAPDLGSSDIIRLSSADIAFVLPLTGSKANHMEKIVVGAEIARQMAERNGQTLRLHIIDSEQPDWLEKLSNLPPQVQFIGGPVLLSDYKAIKQAGLLEKRTFFCFLPRYTPADAADEGNLSWRFFATVEDQNSALLEFSKNLGINTFGALIPDEEYGKRMLATFKAQVEERELYLVKTETYPPQYEQWNRLVAQFLKTEKAAKTAPDTPFQALYLPDTWQDSYRMINNLFYYRENRLLLMGNSLWINYLSVLNDPQKIKSLKLEQPNARYTNMAIFPASWDPNSNTPSGLVIRSVMASKGKEPADLWVSLGFDFASMAANLSLENGTSSAAINAALHNLTNVPWSGAPITWDANGVASQKLFVCTPTENGYILADPARFKNQLNRLWKNYSIPNPPLQQEQPVIQEVFPAAVTQ